MFANTKLKKLIDGLPNQDFDDNNFSLEPVEQLYTLNGDDYYCIRVVKQLKAYLQITFPDIPFDIFLLADIEAPDLSPSATIRFYKVREDYHIVTVEKMDDYLQPVGIFQLSERAASNINLL